MILEEAADQVMRIPESAIAEPVGDQQEVEEVACYVGVMLELVNRLDVPTGANDASGIATTATIVARSFSINGACNLY
jgi:hypothetical protein